MLPSAEAAWGTRTHQMRREAERRARARAQPSVVMLATMTVAFLAPWAASALAAPAARLWGGPCLPGRGGARRAGGAPRPAAGAGASYGGYPGYAIPPRPPALVPPGQ